jgi:hypothetical protein
MNGRMIRAEFLKLRKRRALVWWSAILTIGVVVLGFGITQAMHLASPAKYGPVGGVNGLQAVLFAISSFGAIAAILIGVTAGTGDLSAGVFRELVATGRSRLTLFAVRVPGALLLFVPMIVAAWGVAAIASVTLAGGLAVPSAALLAKSLGWAVLSTSVGLVVALGLASLIGSRAIAIGALMGYIFIAEPLLSGVHLLGAARDAFFGNALNQLAPLHPGGLQVTMTGAVAVVVLAAWVATSLGVGAWRTATRDA